MKKIFLIIVSLAIFTACERKIDEFNVTSGSANFTKYIAVGNSMVAGFSDGALYKTGQSYSIPNIIAGQLQHAGSGAFIQPVVNSEYGVEYPGSGPRLVLGYSTACDGSVSLGPVPYTGQKDQVAPVGYQVNNLGIPGAKSFHLLFPGYAQLNPYYARFATAPGNAVVNEIAPLNPTFFTLWLGDNDVLSYATSGGVGDTITSPAFFGQAMGGVLQYLTANGAKGVIATIPNVTVLPFFTTIPYNGLVLPRQSLVDSVNMAMGLYQLPFTYTLGANPFLIADPTSQHPLFKVRQMQEGELVLLTVPQDSIKCYGMGIISKLTFMPWGIPSQYILTLDEIANIETATKAYNQIITQNLAPTFDLGIVNMNTVLEYFYSGIVWDGIEMNAKFVTGGAFSLDGIHLNPRGSAVAANYYIRAINSKFGSTIPEVNIGSYPGIIFP